MIIRQSPDVPNIIGNVGTLTVPVTMQEATSELANIHIGTRCQKVSVHCIKSRLEGVFEVVSNREKRGVDKKYASVTVTGDAIKLSTLLRSLSGLKGIGD